MLFHSFPQRKIELQILFESSHSGTSILLHSEKRERIPIYWFNNNNNNNKTWFKISTLLDPSVIPIDGIFQENNSN